MGKAEVGSTKYLSNQMKQKGLTRLRWYCQLCNKPNRDENAFKMHCQSPSHVRKAAEAGANFKETEKEFSDEFLANFVSLLKTSHGTKEVGLNRFYQEVIAERHHTHLNSTKWHSLTDFAKHLGQQGICHVIDKEDDGLFISWIDDSPEALRRREAIRRKDLQDKGDEEREQLIIQAQIARARKAQAERLKHDGEARDVEVDDEAQAEEEHELKRHEGDKVKLSFGAKPATKTSETGAAKEPTASEGIDDTKLRLDGSERNDEANHDTKAEQDGQHHSSAPKSMSIKFGIKPQTKNVFKKAFAGAPKKIMVAQPKKMSEAERIMKEEIERKRVRAASGGFPNKKKKV